MFVEFGLYFEGKDIVLINKMLGFCNFIVVWLKSIIGCIL